MKITDLHINGFGIFSDQELDGLSSGINVFVGNNEAGKSTCLAFLRYMLFGLPRKGNKAGWLLHEPLRGGKYAGQLGLETEKLGNVVLDRTFKPNKVNVTGTAGSSLGESALSALLGNVSAPLYNSVYGFSLTELQSKDALSGDAVRNALYGTVHGGGASYTDVMARLSAKRDALFRKRGQNQSINKALKELEEIRKELNASGDSVAQYVELTEKLNELAEQLAEVTAKHRKASVEMGTVSADIRLWGTYTEYKKQKAAFDAVQPLIDFPADGVVRFEELHRSVTEKRSELLETQRGIAGAEEKLCDANAKIHHPLLLQQDIVRSLSEDKKVVAAKVAELGQFSIDLRSTESRLQTHLEQLGSSWDYNAVSSFDISDTTHLEVASLEENVQATQLAVESAGQEQLRIENSARDAVNNLEQNKKELTLLPDTDTDIDTDLLASLEQQRGVIERTRIDVSTLAQQVVDKDRSISQVQKDLGSGWESADILGSDTSISVRSLLDTLNLQVQNTDRNVAESTRELTQVSSELTALKERKNSLLHELETAKDAVETVSACKDGLRSVRRAFSEKELAQSMVSSAGITTGSVLALLGAALIALPFIAPVEKAITYGGVAAVISGILYIVWSRSKAQKKVNDIALRAKGIMQQLPQLFDSSDLTEEYLNIAENKYEEIQQQVADYGIVKRQFEDLEREEVENKQAETVAVDKNNTAIAAQKKAKEEWASAVASFKLSPDSNYNVVTAVMAKVADCRTLLQERESIKENLLSAEQEIELYCSKAQKLSPLVLIDNPDELLAALDELFIRVKDAAKNKEEVSVAKDRVKVATQHLEAIKAELVISKEHVAAVREQYEAVTEAVRQWLDKRGLSPLLRVQDIKQQLQLIKDARQLLTKRNEIIERVNAHQAVIDRYAQEQDNLLEETQIGPELAPDRTVHRDHTQDKLLRILSVSEKAALEAQGLAASIEKDSKRAEVIAATVNDLESKIEALFVAAGGEDENAFRKNFAVYTEQQEIKRALENLHNTLVASAESGDIDQLALRIGQKSEQELQVRGDELKEALDKLENEKSQVEAQMRELGVERGVLTSTDEHTALRIRSEELRAEADSYAKEWARYRIAEHLLTRARERFEREQQPEVVKQASTFFNTITKGAYERIVKPLDEDHVYALTADGSRRLPEDLSRGTVEQLYLSLRLGHILSHSAQNESLPVIMDDIMVNFDPVRAANTAQTIAELAEHNQVFLFTCHPQTVELMEKTTQKLSVFAVENGILHKK